MKLKRGGRSPADAPAWIVSRSCGNESYRAGSRGGRQHHRLFHVTRFNVVGWLRRPAGLYIEGGKLFYDGAAAPEYEMGIDLARTGRARAHGSSAEAMPRRDMSRARGANRARRRRGRV